MNTNKSYDRQTRLPEIGQAGQQRLLGASVLCVGAGGLGSPALLYLAAAGVGRIGIIDFDRVDESNLQRQVLFDTEAVGKPKALEAARRLKVLNPGIQIEAYDEELNAENAARLFPLYDVILDGSDNFETKFLINDAAVKFDKPSIYGALQGFEGQISVFNYQNSPCYRCLYPEKPAQPIMNCAEAGVIGAVAGLIGVTQALQAIQIITGHESFEPLSGKVMTLDTRSMNSRIITLKKNPNCPVCSKNKDNISLSYSPQLCALIPEITVSELKNTSGHILIDVREQYEWDHGHIDGAMLWPLSRIMHGDLPNIEKNAPVILQCQKGYRSLQAAQILKARGFRNITNLAGGYEAWLEEL